MVTAIFFLILSTSPLNLDSVSWRRTVKDSISTVNFLRMAPNSSSLFLMVTSMPLLNFFQFQFKFLNTLFKFNFEIVCILVSSSQFLTIMSQFTIFLFKLMKSLFESVHIDFHSLQFILQFSFVPFEAISFHVGTI